MKFWRDEIYLDVVPGVILGPNEPHAVGHVAPGVEFQGEIAPWFTPPQGLKPADMNIIISGKPSPRDVSAIIVDLMGRGWFRMEKEQGRNDWRLFRLRRPTGDRLTPDEQLVMYALFEDDEVEVSMSHRRGQLGPMVDDILNQIYARALNRRWYKSDPQKVKKALSRLGRAPRTADGTALRIQALGFKRYLVTAEGLDITSAEAVGTFARYLPYAIAFDVATQFAKHLSSVAQDTPMMEGFDPSQGLDALDRWANDCKETLNMLSGAANMAGMSSF